MNRITIVIPTKNRKNFLFRAIDSINKQTYLPYEVIIVDDASNEKISINELTSSLHKKIKCNYIYNESSQGGGSTRNIGVQASSGEYILFLDDDDALIENYIEVTINNLNENSFVYTNKYIVKSSNLNHIVRKTRIAGNNIYLSNFIGGTSGVIVSKAIFLKAGMFDPNLPAFQDYDLWLRLCPIVKPKLISEPGVLYTIFDNTKTSQISSNYNNHITAYNIISNKYRNNTRFKHLKSTLLFFVAKSIHRKNYLKSLSYTLKSLCIKIRLRALILLIPYTILNILNIHTT